MLFSWTGASFLLKVVLPPQLLTGYQLSGTLPSKDQRRSGRSRVGRTAAENGSYKYADASRTTSYTVAESNWTMQVGYGAATGLIIP